MRLRIPQLVLATLLLVVACEKKKEEPTPLPVNPEIKIPAESQGVFNNGIAFDSGCGESAGTSGQKQSTTVKFTATETWSASVTDTKAPTWLSVQPTSGGAGTVTMTVTAQPNTTDKARSATVSIQCGTVKQSFTVNQDAASQQTVAVESITLNADVLSLAPGASETLTATVTPENATDKTITWSSSNAEIATVAEGIVTAIMEGEAIITAVAGEKEATCKVTVKSDVIDVKDLTIIQAVEDSSVVIFEALVCATGSRDFVVTDGSAYLLVNTTDVPCSIGDTVRVSGMKTTRQDMPIISETGLTCEVLSSGNELPAIDYPDITSTLDSFSSTFATPVMVKGTVLGTDLIVEGADQKVFLYWPNEALSVASYDGKTVVIEGIFLSSTNNYRDIMPVSIKEVDLPITITASKYLTFVSKGSTVLSLVSVGENAPVLYYSKDKTHWTRWDYSGLSFSSKSPLYICGNNPKGFSTSWQNYSSFSASGDSFSVSGDVMSLLDNENDLYVIPCDDCFSYLFNDCHLLQTPPSLPATSLTLRCYRAMFWGCDGMSSAPALPATSLAAGCYDAMFSGCSSLEEAPNLPATTLEQQCYEGMFKGCSSLTNAPILPATIMTSCCYKEMFKDCTSLTAAPELPAAVLSTNCYEGMFQGCSKLAYVKCMATDISALSCVDNWLDGVAETGTFVKSKEMSDWPRGGSGIPVGWNVVNFGADDHSGGDEDDKYTGGIEGTIEEDWR